MPKQKQEAKRKAKAAADQDIVGLITTLVERLVSLEAKIDTVLSRVSTRPSETRQQPHSPAPLPGQYRGARPMYKAVCADCRKGCEVPFRPSIDRPVYCKDCFAKRKIAKSFNGRPNIRPQQTPQLQAPFSHAPALEKAHQIPVEKAKTAGRKKAAPKRRKKQ